MQKKKGFTLIELLVVVAIIGLLATLSIVALNTARAKARDAKRVGDIKQIQTALELYYNDNGGYPATASSGYAIASGSNVYMAQYPTPPVPSTDGGCPANVTNYAYTATSSNTSYTISYCLGAATGGLNAGAGTATPAGIK
jgi:type II secretion system protein G